MKLGKVKWFDDKKGYGFIIDLGDKKEFFVDRKAIEVTDRNSEQTLGGNEEVSFVTEPGPKGLRTAKAIRDGGAAARSSGS